MIDPPKCSKEWTAEERMRLAAWIIEITMDRISRDDQTMPLLAKGPVVWLLHAIHLLMTAPADVLEKNREFYEKPYDATKDHDAVVIFFGDGGRPPCPPSEN